MVFFNGRKLFSSCKWLGRKKQHGGVKTSLNNQNVLYMTRITILWPPLYMTTPAYDYRWKLVNDLEGFEKEKFSIHGRALKPRRVCSRIGRLSVYPHLGRLLQESTASGDGPWAEKRHWYLLAASDPKRAVTNTSGKCDISILDTSHTV